MSKGWATFSHQPRFMTNYIGLRNRLSILDENYNYADYKTRVLHCYALLRAILDYASANAEELVRLVAEADRRTVERGLAPKESDRFGLEIEAKPLPQPVTVRGYEVEVIPREGGFPQVKRTDRKKTYTMPYFADFQPKRTVRVPAAYLVAPADENVLVSLIRHGLVVERLVEPSSLEVEAFRLKEVKGAERLFQGHRTNQVKGEYAMEKRDFAAGALVVRTAQPWDAWPLISSAGERRRARRLEPSTVLVPQWAAGQGPARSSSSTGGEADYGDDSPALIILFLPEGGRSHRSSRRHRSHCCLRSQCIWVEMLMLQPWQTPSTTSATAKP
jgi:hypothetical protein